MDHPPPDVRGTLRALAEALPIDSAMSVPVAWIRELLEPPAETVELITVDQAAARMGVTPGYLYRKAKLLPFARKLSHRQLRFDPSELAAWLAARNGK